MSEESKPIAPVGASPVSFPKDEHWRCSCGHFVLKGEGHLCQAIRQADFYERLVVATEDIAASLCRCNAGDAAQAALKAELESARASLSTAEKANTRQAEEIARKDAAVRDLATLASARNAEAEALRLENTRLQEEAALYKQRYQEKAAESQTWAAKAGAHAAENTPLREERDALKEQLSRERKDAVRTVIALVRRLGGSVTICGAELLLASDVKAVLSSAWTTEGMLLTASSHPDAQSDNTSFRPLADAALAANKASEIASDSSALEKALGALRELLRLYGWRFELAEREKDPRNIHGCGNYDAAFLIETRLLLRQYGTEKKAAWAIARTILSGGAHVDGPKAQKEEEK